MARDILISIMSDDDFARNWMSLLVVRDWRTRVVSEFTCSEDYLSFQSQCYQKVDFLLVDLDSYNEYPSLLDEIYVEENAQSPTKLILLGSKFDANVIPKLNPDHLAGYLKKSEVSTSLTWAITYAVDGKRVFTQTMFDQAMLKGCRFEKPYIIVSSRTFPGLTERQSEIARLAIIFSVGRRDLADELKVSDQWSYGMVSELYNALGLEALFSGTVNPYEYLNNDPVISTRLDDILAKLGSSKKAKDLEALAFHLLTMPVIEEYL